MAWMVQYMDAFRGERDAIEAAGFLAEQIDFVAGRILPPSNVDPSWRVQILFHDCGPDIPLPDGSRRVIVPDGVLRQFTPV